MTRCHRWIETTGGPHLLVAEELLHRWRGIQVPNDCGYPVAQSDYLRACQITAWLGSIPCGDGNAVVLSGEAGDIAWIPMSSGQIGFLVQRVGVDDESLIEVVLRSEEAIKALTSPVAEILEFTTGQSGAMYLIDAAESGNDIRGDSQLLQLEPGNYRLRAGFIDLPRLSVVIRSISKA